MNGILYNLHKFNYLQKIDRCEKKRYIYEYYKKHLGRLKGVSLMPQGEEERSNCWLTAIQLSDDCKVKPIDIMLTLEEDDVESRPVWKPLHLQPFFGECDFISDVQELYITDEEMGADNSIAGSIFRKGVCMPSDSKMTDEDLERICGIVKELWV